MCALKLLDCYLLNYYKFKCSFFLLFISLQQDGKNGMNNNDFFEDEDESFYSDINFNPLISDNKATSNKLSNNNNNDINKSNKNILINGSNSKNSNEITSEFYQNINQQSSEINIMNGRTLSPAILAKTIQANRSIPLPGSSRRPPHLRLNNN